LPLALPPPDPQQIEWRRQLEELARLSPWEYAKRRKAAAKQLDVGRKDLDDEVDRIRRELSGQPPLMDDKAKKRAREISLEKACERIDLLFHDADREAWANVTVNRHVESYKVDSEEMRDYLRQQVFTISGKLYGVGLSLPKTMLTECIDLLKTRARVEGPQHRLFLRVGEHAGALYIDLADTDRHVVEITNVGWRVLATRPPIFFRRPDGMLPLPVPERGGSIEELRPFLNTAAAEGDPDPDAAFILTIGWLLAAMRSRGPYPPLIPLGPTGRAKSTHMEFLLSIFDPNTILLADPPEDARDLRVAAQDRHGLGFDNVSHLGVRLSNAFCRMSTGGGAMQRKLHTSATQVRFPEILRPVIINGIEEFVTRPDLQNRSLVLEMQARTSLKELAELKVDFILARPRILGALLDMMVTGLRHLPTTKVMLSPERVRMIDFVKWGMACGLERFAERYEANLFDSMATILDGDKAATALKSFMGRRKEPWQGSVTELVTRLSRFGYTSSPRSERPGEVLRNHLRRIAQPLRNGYGIVVDLTVQRTNVTRLIRVSMLTSPASLVSPKSKRRTTKQKRRQKRQVIKPKARSVRRPNKTRSRKRR